MQRHFDEELKKLNDKLAKMGVLVERSISKTINALVKRDSELAEQLIDEDQQINILEIQIDEFGHELIALWQPTAVDLRMITMVLKITGDLERIGDQAVNIAEKAMAMNKEASVAEIKTIEQMALIAIEMVKGSLEAFSLRDAAKAKKICERDDEIDDLNDQIYKAAQEAMKREPDKVPQYVNLIMVAHNLERIGDLATNVAEDVIYLVKGVDIRHHIAERRDT